MRATALHLEMPMHQDLALLLEVLPLVLPVALEVARLLALELSLEPALLLKVALLRRLAAHFL